MHIVVIGVGYVGLVSGTCFAEMGHQVTCLDINTQLIENLTQGIIPIYEPGLEEMVVRNLKSKRLQFTSDYKSSLSTADICFIAVDTPMSANGSADISRVEAVAESIAENLQNDCIVVTKSTVPVGTTTRVETIIRDALKKRSVPYLVHAVSNPEFLKEGNAIQDFMKPDRVIIGVSDQKSAEIMRQIYSPFMLNHDRLMIMDVISAELSKYAANAKLAARISFMNEMALLCEKFGADVNQIRKAMGADERIGQHFLYPGVGFGGSCLPKDVKALLSQAKDNDCQLSVLEAVYQANENQKKVMGSKLQDYFADKGGLANKTIGILGLAFKPNTDDMREAPSLVLIQELLNANVHLRLFDPIAMEKAKTHLPDSSQITWCQDENDVATGADALVLMTEWKQFRLLDFNQLKKLMKRFAFFDGRNQYTPADMRNKGFDYFCIGRQ